MANPKAFLHEWCAKNNLEPLFETKQAGKIYELFINRKFALFNIICDMFSVCY